MLIKKWSQWQIENNKSFVIVETTKDYKKVFTACYIKMFRSKIAGLDREQQYKKVRFDNIKDAKKFLVEKFKEYTLASI